MADPRVLAYLRTHRSRYPTASLRQALLKAGASAQSIDEAVRELENEGAASAVPRPAAVQSRPTPAAAARPSRAAASYPLAAGDDGFFAALTLCFKTLPFIGLRFGILMAFAVASAIWFALSAGAGAIMGKAVGEQAGWLTFIIGVGVPGGVFFWLKRYVLYMLKLAHVAVLTRLITHGALEPDTGQVAYGKRVVLERFVEVNILFAVDALVDGIVRAFTRTLNFVAAWLPIPGLQGILRLAERIIQNATTYVDETIFSYSLACGEGNVWLSSRRGLIYYAQNWKPILKTAVYALLLEYGVTATLFTAMILPALALGSMMPRVGGALILLSVLTAVALREALLRPLFLTMVALTFHRSIQGQEPDPGMEQTLNGTSDKFRELAERAKGWAARPAGGVPGGVAGPAA